MRLLTDSSTRLRNDATRPPPAPHLHPRHEPHCFHLLKGLKIIFNILNALWLERTARNLIFHQHFMAFRLFCVRNEDRTKLKLKLKAALNSQVENWNKCPAGNVNLFILCCSNYFVHVYCLMRIRMEDEAETTWIWLKNSLSFFACMHFVWRCIVCSQK